MCESSSQTVKLEGTGKVIQSDPWTQTRGFYPQISV